MTLLLSLGVLDLVAHLYCEALDERCPDGI